MSPLSLGGIAVGFAVTAKEDGANGARDFGSESARGSEDFAARDEGNANLVTCEGQLAMRM